MRGPVVEIVLLLLLVVFFGIQQRQRPQLYFRFWTLGWIFVSLSLTIWDIDLRASPPWVQICQEAVRYDFILLAGISFAMALVATRESLGRTVVQVVALALPAALGIDLQMLPSIPAAVLRPLLLVLIGGMQIGAVVFVQVAMPAAWRVRKAFIVAICVVSTIWIVGAILRGAAVDVGDVIVTQVFLCAAVHLLATFRRTLAGVMGGLGFACWGVFYVLPDIFPQWPATIHVIYTFWNVPKYFVGFSMVLIVLEVDSEEKAALLGQLQVLYNDFKGLYEGHPHPVWIADMAEGRFLSINQAGQEAYGFVEAEFLTMRQSELQAVLDEEAEEMERLLPPPPEGKRVRHRTKDGQPVWMNLVERPIVFQGREARMVLARDITQGLRMNRELAFQAQHDPLTGLPNRLHLEERLRQCVEACEREGHRAAVLAIDIDHFKSVNDTHGHLVGDTCLKAVAARLQSRVRQIDTVARTGGEEFVAVIDRLQSVVDAQMVATGLLRQFDLAVKLEDCELAVTISIGVAVYPDDGVTALALQERADQALYEAKRRGRACVVMAGEMVTPEPGAQSLFTI